MLIGLLFIFFGEIPIKILCPFFNWFIYLLLSCKNSLVYVSPLSEVKSDNMVTHSVGCLFIFTMVSFEAQKVLIFMKSSFVNFFLLSLVFWCHEDLLLCFLLRVYSLALIFRPLICSELNFVYSVKKRSNFILCM